MSHSRLLALCARIDGHPLIYQEIKAECERVSDWDGLLERAEHEGMAPLLRRHLDLAEVDTPAAFRRVLEVVLWKRHEHHAQIRAKELQAMLDLLAGINCTPIVLKGAALCHTLYPDPSLRPMRDIDLLLTIPEAKRAQQALKKETGFKASQGTIPEDHFHLRALYKKVEKVNIAVEIHHGLYPDCAPFYPEVNVYELRHRAKQLVVGESKALTLGHEDMIDYLFMHGFRTPLTFEPYRLINAADLIGYIEANFHAIDWDKIRSSRPLLHRALPLMHHISPWNPELIPPDFVPAHELRKKRTPAAYKGWPCRRMKELKQQRQSSIRFLIDTFFPPVWWMKIYYGIATRAQYLNHLLIHHPKHIFWWVRIYAPHLTDKGADSKETQKGWKALLASKWSQLKILVKKLTPNSSR